MSTNKRNTTQRALVLDAVKQLRFHPTSAEVYEAVKQQQPTISRATVYRNLAVLAEMGDVARVPVPNGAEHYDFRTDSHYHAVCRECGAVSDVEASGLDFSAKIKDAHGFSIEGHELVFSGLCQACASKS